MGLHLPQQGVHPVPNAPGQGLPAPGQGLFYARNDVRTVHPLGVGGCRLGQEGAAPVIEPGGQGGGADVHRCAIFFKDGCRGKGGHGTVAADGLHGPAGV